MKKGEGRSGPKRLNLVRKGNASNPNSDNVCLDVLIDRETGDLVMEGKDTGPSVERFLGDDEYEYFVRVEKRHKDRLLLHLVKEVFGEGVGRSASYPGVRCDLPRRSGAIPQAAGPTVG